MAIMKRWIKTVILSCISHVLGDKSGKVVFYHDVFKDKKYTDMGTPLSMFRKHMLVARCRGWKTVDRIPSSDKELMVCFDDGFQGLYDCRDDIKAMDLHPTIFIAVNLVGKEGYMTWKEIEELQHEYGFIFESHTWSHQTLVGRFIKGSPVANRDEAWFKHELTDSKAEIERRLGKKVTSICFPAGLFSDDIVTRCQAAGYTNLFASYPGKLPITAGGVIPRHLVQGSNEREFIATLQGGLLPFKNRYLRQHKHA